MIDHEVCCVLFIISVPTVQCQADWEQSRKELGKARHDVERLRHALDRGDVEKRDQQQKTDAARQALQVPPTMIALLSVSVSRQACWALLRDRYCFVGHADSALNVKVLTCIICKW